MAAKITVWGFSGSTYVRTVRMLLAEKGVSDYEQVPVDVLKGEPKSEEHLTRHPFGKVRWWTSTASVSSRRRRSRAISRRSCLGRHSSRLM